MNPVSTDAVSMEWRFALTMLVEVAFIAFVIWKLVVTRRRRALAVLVFLFALAGQVIVFDIFLAEEWPESGYVHYGWKTELGSDFGIGYYETTTPWFHYNRARVVVLTRHSGAVPIDSVDRGFGVRVGGPVSASAKVLRGRGRIFVVEGPGLAVLESTAPIFTELYGAVDGGANGGAVAVLERLKSGDRKRLDAALRRFLELPESD